MKINRNKMKFGHGANGFTIMELLVVSILMAIVGMIVAQFWRWFSPGVSDLIAREHILHESRLLMQSLAYDFGAAKGAVAAGSGRLGIDITGDESSEIYYNGPEEGSKTVQRVLPDGTGITIADGISDFSVVEESSGCLVTVQFEGQSYNRSQPFRKQIVFHWSPAP